MEICTKLKTPLQKLKKLLENHHKRQGSAQNVQESKVNRQRDHEALCSTKIKKKALDKTLRTVIKRPLCLGWRS